MSDDSQAIAESIDEEVLGAEQPLSDEVPLDPIPDAPLGLPFADADVTDESVADRAAREEPEVWERPLTYDSGEEDAEPTLIVDTDLIERLDEEGTLGDPL